MTSLPFEFTVPGRIVCGPGAADRLGEIAAGLGHSALLLCGGRSLEASGGLGRLRQGLAAAGVACRVGRQTGEPDIDGVDRLAAEARGGGCDLVLGVGGGSVIDTAKAVAGLLGNDGPVRRYMELVGDGVTLPRPGAPMIAVPTTAGTGAEATRNSVLSCPERRIKASMRSVHLLPRAVILDPDLSAGLPPLLTAVTGLDALTQLIESCASRRATRLTTALALEGIGLVSRCLRRACAGDDDPGAREGMARAALLSGITLAHAGLGAAHGIAGPLGGMIDVAHGTACARLLPPVLETNLRALLDRDPLSPALTRLDEACAVLLGRSPGAPEDTVPAAADWVRTFCDEAAVPGLGAHGLDERHLDPLVAAAGRASSMKANPVTLTGVELAGIIGAAR